MDNVINILLVEDNPGDVRLLQEILRDAGSSRCEIVSATSLKIAIEILSRQDLPTFDAILLDLSLPDSQGLNTFTTLHAASHIPIVILTGLDDENLALVAMQQGAQDYIIKGQADRHLLLRSIRYAIERERAETALRQTKLGLEQRVIERTRDLQLANHRLQQSETALQDALQKLNLHFENSPLAVIEWDCNFHVARWSAMAEKIFGWNAAEVLGKHPDDWQFVAPEDVERIYGIMQRLLSGEEYSNITVNRNYRSNGTIVECEWYNSALLDETGRMESVLSLVVDVTDRHQIARMKDEFIGVVSHELRTPLTSIYGSLAMLASGLLDPHPAKVKRLLDIAVDSTDRLMRLVNDILDVERIESGNVQMTKAIWVGSELMQKAVEVVEPLAEKAGITICTTYLNSQVWVDADRLIQTFTNLLDNAIKFSPRGSTIWFTATKRTGQILFQVRDRGRGIPQDKLAIIFERFQQVDGSDARQGEGTGLGLAICRSIIQQHGGQIWVESIPGEGSTFSFLLPRSPSASDSKPPISINN